MPCISTIEIFMSELKRFALDQDISIHLVAHQVTPMKGEDGRYFKPDLTLCAHFQYEGTGHPGRRQKDINSTAITPSEKGRPTGAPLFIVLQTPGALHQDKTKT